MSTNASNADLSFGKSRAHWIRTCYNLLTGARHESLDYSEKRKWMDLWNPVSRKNKYSLHTCVLALPPKLSVPWALSLVLSFTRVGKFAKEAIYRSHVVTLSEEETGSITHLRWPSMRKSSSGRRDALPLLKSTLTRQWYNQGNICQWCSSGRAAWGELCELPALGWECRVWQAEFKNTGRHHGQPRGEQFLGKKAN